MAKNRRHLYPEEARLLGLEVKPNEKLKNNAKYTINDEDWETVKEYRTQPKERQFVETVKKLNADGEILSTIEKLQSEPIPIPEDFEIIKISTSKTTGQQWIQYAQKTCLTILLRFFAYCKLFYSEQQRTLQLIQFQQ